MVDVPVVTPSLFLLPESNLTLTQVHLLLGHASLPPRVLSPDAHTIP
jgi:hypothetical protein